MGNLEYWPCIPLLLEYKFHIPVAEVASRVSAEQPFPEQLVWFNKTKTCLFSSNRITYRGVSGPP